MLPVPHPIVSGVIHVPGRYLSARDLASLKKDLTGVYVDTITGAKRDIQLWKPSPYSRDGICIPREYGERVLGGHHGLRLRRMVKPNYGSSVHLFPKSIAPRDDDQREFMRAIVGAMRADPGPWGTQIQICASTGSGKTVAALNAFAEVGANSVLVIVHRNRLKDQWLGSISEKKGMRYFWGTDWVNKHVGVVQQGECNYRGKLVVVAMAPPLYLAATHPIFTNNSALSSWTKFTRWLRRRFMKF